MRPDRLDDAASIIGDLVDALHNYRAYYTDESESYLDERAATEAMARGLEYIRGAPIGQPARFGPEVER